MYVTLCQYNIMHAFAYSWICVLTMPNSTRFYNILNFVIQNDHRTIRWFCNTKKRYAQGVSLLNFD